MQNAILSIHLKNLLSFGDHSDKLEFRSLNVLIGPNGSGKSNLIETFGLLQSTARDLTEPIRAGGGVVEWLWKGNTRTKSPPLASIEILANYGNAAIPIRYYLSFTRTGFTMEIIGERIESARPFGNKQNPYLYFENENGRAIVNVKGENRQLKREDIDPRQSILSQRKDPDQYPEITYLGRLFSKFAFYRDWEFGINAEARDIHAPDQQSEFLEEDASNLGLMLNRLRAEPSVKPQLLDYLRAFYADAEDVHVQIREGLVEMRLEEKSGFTTPARRLSDGTLRWLSLLSILLNPDPPPLVFIEEPELGLHPDVIHVLANLLKEAAKRMQIVITTHSSALVEEFTDQPESVVVCEKIEGATILKRLDTTELSDWLQRYTLGELWRKGEVGGNRW